MVHRMDNRACAQKQQGLEKRMGEQMENADGIAPNPQCHKHVAKLRTGGIGDDALDVVLHQTNSRRKKRGDAADDCDKTERIWCQIKQRRQARHHENASRDHGRGMDEGGNRGWPLHRVRQPGVKQELRRFAHRPHEQQQTCHGQRIDIHAKDMNVLADQSGSLGKNRLQRNRTGEEKQQENAQRKAKIADAIDDESLDRRRIGAGLLIPEANQQVGSQAHPFPAKKHLHQIVRRHQHQHGKGEQAEIGEKALAGRIFVHIANGIDMDEAGYAVDHHQHHHRQRVDPQGPVNLQIAGMNPRGDLDDFGVFLMAKANREERNPRQDGGQDQQAGRDDFGIAGADLATKEASNQEADKRGEDNDWIQGSTLHHVNVFNRDGTTVAEIGDENGKADGGLRRCDGQDEYCENLASQIARMGGKSHEIKVDRQQDQFHRHQDDDDVLAVEDNPRNADGEQDRGNDEIMGECDHVPRPPRRILP